MSLWKDYKQLYLQCKIPKKKNFYYREQHKTGFDSASKATYMIRYALLANLANMYFPLLYKSSVFLVSVCLESHTVL